jgi:hypothetical protein
MPGRISLAVLGQFHRPVEPVEQLDPKVILKLPDLVAQGSRRHRQLIGCGLEAHQPARPPRRRARR